MIRVALVDDQTLVRQGIRSLLELAGDIAIVAEAEDGEQALAIIAREKPDLVLLDVRMPRKTGLDVLRDLKAGAIFFQTSGVPNQTATFRVIESNTQFNFADLTKLTAARIDHALIDGFSLGTLSVTGAPRAVIFFNDRPDLR